MAFALSVAHPSDSDSLSPPPFSSSTAVRVVVLFLQQVCKPFLSIVPSLVQAFPPYTLKLQLEDA